MARKFDSLGPLLAILLVLCALFPAFSSVDCPNNCSGRGQCDTSQGFCHCPFEYIWSEDCSQERHEFIDLEQFHRYVIFVLCIYSGLELVTLVVLVYLNWGFLPTKGISTQTVCYLCLFLAFASRLAYYAIDPGAFYLTIPAWLDRVLHFIMFVLLFSAFTAILYNWAASNWRASMARKDVLEKLKRSFIGINMIIYSIEIVFTIVTGILDNGQGFLRTQSVVLYLIFMCIKLFVMGSAFAYFGIKIYLQMKQFTPMTNDGLRAIRMVKILTTITSTIFILALVYIALFVWKVRYRSEMFLISDAIINIFSWIAASLVMILLGKPRRPKRKDKEKEKASLAKDFGTFPGSNRGSQGSDTSAAQTDEEQTW